MNLINHLLRKNVSVPQIIGFVLSNFLGLAIVIAGVQLYMDVRSLWNSEDSFLKKEYIVVNKLLTAADTFNPSAAQFTPTQIEDLKRQPWVRGVGSFTAADYRLYARVVQGGRSMSTQMFFESLPDEYIDVAGRDWKFAEGDSIVPIIISKDYLSLYNFGFASGSGLPRLAENTISKVPLQLEISGQRGRVSLTGRIVGFSNRLNTILVPQSFMEWSNGRYGDHGQAPAPSRLIIDTNSPGDVRISGYMEDNGLEVAGEKGASQAAYMLNVLTGVVLSIGVVITAMSLFILLMSISLLMYKNRGKIHTLIMLGYDLKCIAAPYRNLVLVVNVVAWGLAVAAMLLLRAGYIDAVVGMGAEPGPVWVSMAVGIALLLPVVAFNVISIRRKVRGSFAG